MSPTGRAYYGGEPGGSYASSASSHPSTSSSYQEEVCRSGEERLKCVFVGDAAVGKTSLIVSYTTNGYPHEYLPTAFDNYSVVVRVDNRPVRLQLCDTAGQDEFKSLRQLCYPDGDVFLLCFSVTSPASFYALEEQWVREVRAASPNSPLILIGTQADLRTSVRVLLELSRYGESPVGRREAEDYAKEIGATNYIECSALTQLNLKEVFDAAILCGLSPAAAAAQPPSSSHFVQEVKGGVVKRLRARLGRTNSIGGGEGGEREARPTTAQPTPLSPGLKRRAEEVPFPPPRHLHYASRGQTESGYQSDTGLAQSSVMLRRQLSNTKLNDARGHGPPRLPPHLPQPKVSKLKKGWKRFMCLF